MAAMIQLAGRELPLVTCVNLLAGYPCRTLREYDGRAMLSTGVGFRDDDLVAVRVIEKRALHDHVQARIRDRAVALPWETTPHRLIDISELTVQSVAYEQLSRFYRCLLAIDGVGPAIASKLMYLKWPRATPIIDRLIRDLYSEPAKEEGRKATCAGLVPRVLRETGWTRLFTMAIREDVLANRAEESFDRLREELRGSEIDSRSVEVMTRVSDTRLLDMIAWLYEKDRRRRGANT